MTVRIEGHTDSDGDDEYNRQLSDGRARAVRAYLVEHGVEAARLEAVGYGETQPIADNLSASGRQQNRRVEVIIKNPSTELLSNTGGAGDDQFF